MSYGVSPGNVAVHHGVGSSSSSSSCCLRMKMAELILRVLILGFGVVAAARIASGGQVRVIFTIRKKAHFTDIKALVLLVIVNGIVSAYSFVQVVRCVVGIFKGYVLFNKPLAWLIFSADQVMAYLTMASVAVAAESAMISKFGLAELQWMKTCNLYDKFCNQMAVGMASSVVVSVCTVILSCISAYSLFRLYGENKNKNSTRW